MIAIIGGTGLNRFLDGAACKLLATPYGDVSAPIIEGELATKAVFFLARHGSPHTIPPHRINYRANMWALKQLGVRDVLAVNAVGGIKAQMPAGTLVLADQLVDYSYGREHTYSDGSSSDLQHVDFSYPFDERLRHALIKSAEELSLELLPTATYAVSQGPRLETAAEIDRMERDGCDIVGMTAMPEAGLARELGLNYASLCLVVNPAAGRSDAPITLQAIQSVVDVGMQQVRQLLLASLPRL